MARASYPTAASFVPSSRSLAELATAAEGCRGCNLYEAATQVVFGAGGAGSRLVLVGEQPGDVEDRRGEPFVGPAGTLLDRALDEAGIDRSAAYVTNAVKHFRFRSTASSTRRIHAKPDAAHVSACQPWLTAELRVVDPVAVVALGATAASALFGPKFRVTQDRGVLMSWPPASGPYADIELGPALTHTLATIHPSAVLRADSADRDRYFDGLVSDLRVAADVLH